MQDIQEIFNRIQAKKAELKDLKTIYKDVLDNSQEYQELLEEMRVFKQKKKDLESIFKDELANEIMKMEEIKLDIKTDQEMIGDIALTTIMQGNEVQLTDEYDSVYEPIFSVKFKKTN